MFGVQTLNMLLTNLITPAQAAKDRLQALQKSPAPVTPETNGGMKSPRVPLLRGASNPSVAGDRATSSTTPKPEKPKETLTPKHRISSKTEMATSEDCFWFV